MSDSHSVKKSSAGVQPRRRRLRVLTRRSDFLRTFRSGRKVQPSDWMVFNFSLGNSFRCGWTCPRGVGAAPMRNRMKRWAREWLRTRMKLLNAASKEAPLVDLNIGFRPMPEDFYKQLKHADFDQSMERGWNQLLTQVKRTPSDRLIKPVDVPSNKSVDVPSNKSVDVPSNKPVDKAEER